MGLYVGDKDVTKILNGDNDEINYVSTKDNGVYPPAGEEITVTFEYTGADQHWTAPATGELTIECFGAGAGNAGKGGYAKGTVKVRQGDKFSIVCGARGNGGGRYGFAGASNYSNSFDGGGLSGVFTGDAAVADTDAARALVIGGGAGGNGAYGTGGNGGGETGGNGGAGGGCGSPGYGGTQTAKGGGGAQVGGQFHGSNGSGTYGSGGGGGWFGGGGTSGDGSRWDDQSAGGGSGYVISTATNRVLTQGGGSAAGVDGKVILTFNSKQYIPTPTYVTQAGIYHNPDLGLISMSSDGENWVTIADKNVGATSCDPTEQNSYGKTFQYGNIYGFPGEGDSTAITTSSVIPSLSGYEGGNLYSDSTYRTNMSWLGRNTNLWKGIAFTNLKSLEKGPCPLGFHVPTKAEFEDVIDVLQSIIGEEEEITLETLETYFLMSHPKVRKGSGSFSTDYIDSIYGTLDVELDHDIELFGGRSLSPGLSSGGTILGFLGFRIHQYSQSSALSIEMGAGLANTSMYIRPFRDKAMIPTTSWTRLSPGGHARLPHEYQEVEYIESTGTQWIDSGYIPKGTSGFEMKFRNISAINTYRTLIGTRTDTSTAAFWIGWMNNKCYMEMSPANIEYTRSDGWFNTGIDYEMSFLNKTLICNGETFQSGTNFTQDSARNLYIFSGNSNGQAQPFEAAASRMYYLKLYEGENLVRDFVPCYRRKDGVIGMYDLANDQFYTNAGTGAFLKGGEVNAPAIPESYQEVKYIEQTGTQCIDTGVTPTEKTLSKIKFMNLETTGDIIYGYNPNNDTADYRFFNASGANYLDFPGGSGSGNRLTGGTCSANTIYEYEVGNFYVKDLVSGSNVLSGTAIGAFTGIRTITLGWSHANNNSSKNRWYYVQIFEGSEMIRWMIPCIRKSDSEPGMYDLVTKTFYTNAGTGSFNVGLPKRYKTTADTLLYLPIDGDDNATSAFDGLLKNENASWYGTANYETLSSGKRVLNFTGSQGLYLNNRRLLDNQPYTIAMWVQKNGSQTQDATIISNQRDSGNYGQVIAFNGSNQVYTFYGNGSNAWLTTTDVVSFTDGVWVQYTITVSGNVIKKYINNSLVQTVTNSQGPAFGSATNFSIGFLQSNGSSSNYRFFKGKLADLIVETGERSADKRADFFNATKADYGV